MYDFNGTELYKLYSKRKSEGQPFVKTAVSGMTFITRKTVLYLCVMTYEGHITTYSFTVRFLTHYYYYCIHLLV